MLYRNTDAPTTQPQLSGTLNIRTTMLLWKTVLPLPNHPQPPRPLLLHLHQLRKWTTMRPRSVRETMRRMQKRRKTEKNESAGRRRRRKKRRRRSKRRRKRRRDENPSRQKAATATKDSAVVLTLSTQIFVSFLMLMFFCIIFCRSMG